MLRLPLTLLVALCAALMIACNPSPSAPTPPPPETTSQPASEATGEVTTESDATATATPIRRATLPPTWTPTPEPTEESTADAAAFDPAAATQAFDTNTCQEFGPDFRRSENLTGPGEPVDVFWHPAGREVFYYEVTLKDLSGVELHRGRTTPRTTSYTFDGDLFEPNNIYTWTIIPYDSSADVLCDSRTSEIRVHSG